MKLTVNCPEDINWKLGDARINSMGEEEISEIILALCEGSPMNGQLIVDNIRHGSSDYAFKAVETTRIELLYALESWQEQVEKGECPPEQVEVDYHPVDKNWSKDPAARMFALDKAGVLSAMGCDVSYA